MTSNDYAQLAKLDELLHEIEESAKRGLDWMEMNHEEYERIWQLARSGRALLAGSASRLPR